jgi:Tfp pilus assembly protein FimT
MKRSAMLRNSGITLVETMVVVVIMGLLLAVGIPNFARSNRGRTVEAAANDMAARINLERQRAITTRVPHRLLLIPGSNGYRTERQENDSTWVADGDSIYSISAQVIWEFTAGGNAENADIEFESRGTVLAEDAPFAIKFSNADGDSATVSLVRTGRVTVHRAMQ